MSKKKLDADAVLKRAQPLANQKAHEIQPFGRQVHMPIAPVVSGQRLGPPELRG